MRCVRDITDAERITLHWPDAYLLRARILEKSGGFNSAYKYMCAYLERTGDVDPVVEQKIKELIIKSNPLKKFNK